MRFKYLSLGLALASTSAFAQVLIPALPSSTTLSGSEIVPISQGGSTKKTTVTQIQQSGTQTTNTVLAAPNGSSGSPTFRALTTSDLPVGTSGATIPLLNGSNAWGSKQNFLAASSASGSINLPNGTAPTSPTNGDVWTTSDGLFTRTGGYTNGPNLTNPTRPGGLSAIAPDGLGTVAGNREYMSLTGSRTTPYVARSIEWVDAQTAPASGAGFGTAQSASYGLSLVGYRDVWNTSGRVGEMDGLNIALRQASGDTAGILSNIGVRNGFAATLESYTFSSDSSGAVIKAVNLQMGVVNPRDGGEYGYVAQSSSGTGLTAAFRASNIGTATWSDFFQGVDSSGTVLAEIRAADGAYIGGSVAPRTNLGADIGGPSTKYANIYARFSHLDPVNFGSLPTCNAGGNGTVAYIYDASAAITTWHQAVTAGGGTNTAYVTCNGTSWNAFSY